MATVKAFVHAKIFDKFDGVKYEKTVDYSIFSFDMTSNGYAAVCEIDVEFDEPPYKDIVNNTVKVMREKQVELRAESQAMVVNIERQIQELLCIENHVPDEV